MLGIPFIVCLFLGFTIVFTRPRYFKSKNNPPLWFIMGRTIQGIKDPQYIKAHIKGNMHKARVTAGIEYPDVTKAVMILLPMLIFTVIAITTGVNAFHFGTAFFPIAMSAIEPREILGTGYVEAYAPEFGATNNAVKLQACVDYCETNDKRQIYLGNTDWTISETITIPKDTADWFILGYGRNNTVLTSTIAGFDSSVFWTEWSDLGVHRVDGITFDSFKIVGSTDELYGVDIDYGTPAIFRDMMITNCGSAGIAVSQTFAGGIFNCEISSNSQEGVSWANLYLRTVNHYSLYYSNFDSSNGHGMTWTACVNNTMASCAVQSANNTAGVRIREYCHKNNVVYNYFEGNNIWSLNMTGADGESESFANVIAFNYFQGGDSCWYGIVTFWTKDNLIHDNEFRQHTVASINDGYVNRAVTNTSIYNNVTYDETFLVIGSLTVNCRVGINTYVGVTTYITDGGTDTILPTVSFPFTEAFSGATRDEEGIDVDAATEYAKAFFDLPEDCTQVQNIMVKSVARNAEADGMLADFIVNGGGDNEAFNTHTVTLASEVSTTTGYVSNDNVWFSLTNAVITALTARDSGSVKALFRVNDGTNEGTDAQFKTITIRYV